MSSLPRNWADAEMGVSSAATAAAIIRCFILQSFFRSPAAPDLPRVLWACSRRCAHAPVEPPFFMRPAQPGAILMLGPQYHAAGKRASSSHLQKGAARCRTALRFRRACDVL